MDSCDTYSYYSLLVKLQWSVNVTFLKKASTFISKITAYSQTIVIHVPIVHTYVTKLFPIYTIL